MSPIVQMAWSPVPWPKRSFIALKSFMSIMMPYREPPPALRLSSNWPRYLRLNSPESSSLYRFSAYVCICTNTSARAVETHAVVIP